MSVEHDLADSSLSSHFQLSKKEMIRGHQAILPCECLTWRYLLSYVLSQNMSCNMNHASTVLWLINLTLQDLMQSCQMWKYTVACTIALAHRRLWGHGSKLEKRMIMWAAHIHSCPCIVSSLCGGLYRITLLHTHWSNHIFSQWWHQYTTTIWIFFCFV